MKAIILAGGYGKRLLPLTKDTPKPLLQVGNKTVIGRIIEKLEVIEEIDSVLISTNARFEGKFKAFMTSAGLLKPTKLVVEPSVGEEEKLGSIGGLRYILDQEQVDDDVIIIGGDNLFEFDLQGFIDDFNVRKHTLIALKKIEDHEQLRLFGVCDVSDDVQIIDFQEKPDVPKSDLASTALYCFTKNDIHLVKDYLEEGNSPDAMGSFVSWLIHKSKVYGHIFGEDWIDIGSIQAYKGACKLYEGS